MTSTLTPSEELKMRQHCAEAWSRTWAKAPELTPEQAFTEGCLLGLKSGILAGREIRLKADRRLQWLLLLELVLWAAGTWVMGR